MHVDGHIRDAFCELVLNGETGVEFYNYNEQARFEAMNRDEKLLWISGKLWHCTDTMPSELRKALCEQYPDVFIDEPGTYAQAAQRLRRFAQMPLLGA